MSEELITQGVTGGSTSVDSTALAEKIGALGKVLEDSSAAMAEAKSTDTARWHEQHEINAKAADQLSELQSDYKARLREEETAKALDAAREMREFLASTRAPAKAIGGTPQPSSQGYVPGSFLFSVFQARSGDMEDQTAGKSRLAILSENFRATGDAKAVSYEASWGKATLGTTDALGGWIIPNAVVDEFIKPATFRNIYRDLMTVVPGVTGAAVDIPFRAAATARAVIAPFGDTKENVNLAYNGYTATMYTLARIYDVGNQFLRQSQGAAETDVLQELASAFALGEAYYIREGTGSSQPFGYTAALTNGPAAYRSTFSSPSDSTVAGSIAAAIAVAAGDLAGRGVTPTAAVLSATAYWQMLRQGSDSAGFWFATQERAPNSIRPGTLISPFGIPVFADATANAEGTSTVTDNLTVADWTKFKVYFGQSYRVDRSDQAGERWDKNLTGFRGEEEMGFDARPTVYAGHAQMIADILA